MEKNGEFIEGVSRSDFDMTKLGKLKVLGEDSLYIGSEDGSTTFLGNYFRLEPKSPNKGGAKFPEK